MLNPEAIAKLISRVALHDRPAFDLLYKHTCTKLFGVLLRLLRDRAEAEDGGMHVVQTVGGCNFVVMINDGWIQIRDGQGNIATVTIADVAQSNGVIHVIDRVLLPAS